MRTPILALLVALAAATAGAQAQGIEVEKAKKAAAYGLFVVKDTEGLEPQPLAPSTGVRNAPFTADAVTEFVQVLGDGNRIERSATASIARDSLGRTRRVQEIAMVGALANLKAPDTRLVVISDPVSGGEITLDEERKVARRTGAFQLKVSELHVLNLGKNNAGGDEQSKVTTQSLGTRTIEGLQAEGTRTTRTIAAGAVGNVKPIDVVTERWHSKDLQMDVLITRQDPRNGDTTYRLSNVVRAEPPADLFTVPADYTVERGKVVQRLERKIVGKGTKK